MLIEIRDSEDEFVVQFEGEMRIEEQRPLKDESVVLHKCCVIRTDDGFILNKFLKEV